MSQDTLRYTAPSHGDWGIVRVASLVPESYSLFVCPFACGRHGALGAVRQGFKHRLAYIFIQREDIIKGYDNKIMEGVDCLLGRLKERPKAVFVYVSCLDDLIGTDLDTLMDRLHENHPDVEFRAAHMNPIALDTNAPPGLTTQFAMFDFLRQSGEKSDTVNLMGNLERVDPACELFDFLRAAGIKPLHLSDFDTFEGYQQMGQSKYNLLLSPAASMAAKSMEKKHGIPFLSLPVSYDLDEIQRQYAQLRAFLGRGPDCGFSQIRNQAEEEIKNTLDAMGRVPIVLSSGAALRPFALAAALKKYGFNIAAVVAQEATPLDKPGFDEIRKSQIMVIQPEHPDTIRFGHRMPGAVSIGFDAAYITGSENIVNLSNDATMFGYCGVIKLMRMIRGALNVKSDLKQLIEAYGVVI
jgi:nitrogenase molybdenum-iron protein alpha/beta subunit